ncbi:MAG: isochorismatase family cysteine hydrolase [Opitutaceae bacterium]|jgi:maleamate amidohydrolase
MRFLPQSEPPGASSRINPSGKDALIVVDMQRGYLDASLRSSFPNAYSVELEMLSNVNALVECAHNSRIPVYFSVISFSPEQAVDNLWVKHVPQLGLLRAHSAFVEVDSRIGFKPEQDVLVAKQYPSVFTCPTFVTSLRNHDITRCIFCGITMSGCIMASVMDALPRGITPIVVRDAVADRTDSLRDIALGKVQKTYSEVWLSKNAQLAFSINTRTTIPI